MAVSDFLSNLGRPETIGGIAATVLGLNEARNATGNLSAAYAPNSYDAMYQQLANQLQTLTGQLADTNNPQFQSRVNARRDEIMRQYEQQLRQQQAVEARRYGRTGMGMVNPERRDEAISRSLAAFRSQAEAQARAEAMNELVQAAKTGTGVAKDVALPGAERRQSQQVAQANQGNQYDAAKKNAYLALAGQVLGPLLKGIDFSKMVGAASAPTFAAPKIEAAMGSPELGLAPQSVPQFAQGAAGFTAPGMETPSWEAPAWSDPSFDIGGWNDWLGTFNQPNMTMSDFPGFESAALPATDPGGYSFDFSTPQFDASQFTPSFDFAPVEGFDFGGWDFGAGGW